MDALERQERRQIHPISSYFGVDDEEEIPDMAEYEVPDNAVDIVAVRILFSLMNYRRCNQTDYFSIDLNFLSC